MGSAFLNFQTEKELEKYQRNVIYSRENSPHQHNKLAILLSLSSEYKFPDQTRQYVKSVNNTIFSLLVFVSSMVALTLFCKKRRFQIMYPICFPIPFLFGAIYCHNKSTEYIKTLIFNQEDLRIYGRSLIATQHNAMNKLKEQIEYQKELSKLFK